MTSSELNIVDEKSLVGARFMARVVKEIRRAASIEKSSRKVTQQAIAKKIGTTRPVINRQMQGLENLSARRIAEILWALGWEPHFEARQIPSGNTFHAQPQSDLVVTVDVTAGDGAVIEDKSGATNSAPEVFKGVYYG